MAGVALSQPGLTFSWAGRLRPHAMRISIVLAVLVLWQVLALTIFAGRYVVPTPTAVLSTAVHDHFYGSDLFATLGVAWKGWLFGNLAALAAAAVCLLIPPLESVMVTMGVATYCVPTIAVGPIFVVLYGGDGAKVVMSALSVFFVTLVAGITGLRAASPTTLDAITAFGGSRWDQLTKVRLRSSLPMLASGLSISAPAAILGAMIGDYLGAQHGLGVILLQAQQQLAVERTWAISLVSTAVCGAAFLLTAAVAKRLGADVEAPIDAGLTRRQSRSLVLSTLVASFKAVVAIAVGLVLWLELVRTSGLDSFFVKTPTDVWHYLFTGPDASTHLHALLKALRQTGIDAGLGWAAGTVVAVIVAYVLVLLPSVAVGVMPFVIVLRSVPLIAMCPLLGLVFGRGLLGVTVIAGLVTFVPTLVTMVGALRSAPSGALDVVHCSGGSRLQALVKVRTPFATPALFAAAKISMPGAVLGAVLSEWLITSRGLGYVMSYDIISSDYGDLFASIALILTVSLALYGVVNALEAGVRRRMEGA